MFKLCTTASGAVPAMQSKNLIENMLPLSPLNGLSGYSFMSIGLALAF